MKMLCSGISAEWLKTRRTPVRPLVELMPILLTALIIGFGLTRGAMPHLQLYMFRVFFEVWTVLVVPLAVGIVPGLLAHQEGMAGRFYGLLGSPLPRRQLYLAKLILMTILLAFGTVLATVMMALGAGWVAGEPVLWAPFGTGAVLVIVGTVPLLAFHCWVSFAWGLGASVGLGGIGLLIAALMATSLGDAVWPWVPWAWPVRLAQAVGITWAHASDGWTPLGLISSLLDGGAETIGMIAAVVCWGAMLAGGLVWFERWEGRSGSNGG